jgi:RimJ/RimL family protein N-acetyltransferase
MQTSYRTPRLLLTALSLQDIPFMMELVNTPEWLHFIGDRNVHDEEEAATYLQKIIDNKTGNCWVVRTMNDGVSIGIITLMQRDYLEQPDIGFAFLPRYGKLGFAYEATTIVLHDAMHEHQQIFAITIQENNNSIRLLEKLGFAFEKEIHQDDEDVLIYARQY